MSGGRPEWGWMGAEFELSRRPRAFRRARRSCPRHRPHHGRWGTRPDANTALGLPQNGKTESRVHVHNSTSSVLEEMQPRATEPVGSRSSVGSRPMCHSAAAMLVRLLELRVHLRRRRQMHAPAVAQCNFRKQENGGRSVHIVQDPPGGGRGVRRSVSGGMLDLLSRRLWRPLFAPRAGDRV